MNEQIPNQFQIPPSVPMRLIVSLRYLCFEQVTLELHNQLADGLFSRTPDRVIIDSNKETIS